MNQNHANRGKAARVTQTAATVVQSLKHQGVQISQAQETAATSAAVAAASIPKKVDMVPRKGRFDA